MRRSVCSRRSSTASSSSRRCTTWRTSSVSSVCGSRPSRCTKRRVRWRSESANPTSRLARWLASAFASWNSVKSMPRTARWTHCRFRMGSRPDWFQNRELVEAFFVRMAARDGAHKDAVERFMAAATLAESSDLYCAAWLTATCADDLMGIDPKTVKSSISRYGERVRKLGYAEMTRRYDSLLSR